MILFLLKWAKVVLEGTISLTFSDKCANKCQYTWDRYIVVVL